VIFQTLLPDGAVVTSATSADQEAFALQLGYETADHMNAQHDRLHLFLCQTLGLSESPTLRRVVTSDPACCSDDMRAHEESMVLAAQGFLNAAKREGWL
jgi:hypothetical protein